MSAIHGILEHLLLLEDDALSGNIVPQELIAMVMVTNSIFTVSHPLFLILVLFRTLFMVKISVCGGLESKYLMYIDVGRCSRGRTVVERWMFCRTGLPMSRSNMP